MNKIEYPYDEIIFNSPEERFCSGIYCFLNTKTNEYYFGSAIRLIKRFYGHVSCLKKQKHKNLIIQSIYNKHGFDIFKFIVIKSFKNITYKELIKEEQIWVDCFYDNQNKCYNIAKVVNAPMYGRKHTDESKKLMSESTKGKNHPNWGIPMTEERKENLRRINLGKKQSTEVIIARSIRMSGSKNPMSGKFKEEHPAYGKTRTEESINKMTKYKFITKEFLIEHYINQNKTYRQIAKEFNCSCKPIQMKIKKFNIRKLKK